MLRYTSLLFVMIATLAPVFAGEYVVLIQSGVNIRTAPDTSSVIVGQASKGELHPYAGETDGWFRIRMFSGEERFIFKALAAKLTEDQILPGHNLELSLPHDVRRTMRLQIMRADERAMREAEEIIPAPLDKERNLGYRKILEDRYILRIFRNHGVQPALYAELMDQDG